VKGLFAEDGAAVTAVNVARRAALLGDGRNPAESLKVPGLGMAYLKAAAICSSNSRIVF